MHERTRGTGAWRLLPPRPVAADETAAPSGPIRLLFADALPVVREGLRAMIGGDARMIVVGEAATGPQTVTAFRRLRPDVTLLDLRLPALSGVDVTTTLVRESPRARVLVFTEATGDEEVYQALRAGARGYMLKS